MHKNISKLECTVNEKLFQLFCECDSTTTEIKEALFQFSNFIGKLEESSRKSQVQVTETSSEEG